MFDIVHPTIMFSNALCIYVCVCVCVGGGGRGRMTCAWLSVLKGGKFSVVILRPLYVLKSITFP